MSRGIVFSNITSQLWAVSEALTGIGTYRLEIRKVHNDAISSMRKALNRTRRFLQNPDYSDIEKLTELSDLWNEASNKVGVINPSLGEMLGNKSRFWSDHELFISLGRNRDIISLNEVVSEIDRLYLKLR
jgi:hypothetical protein